MLAHNIDHVRKNLVPVLLSRVTAIAAVTDAVSNAWDTGTACKTRSPKP